MNLLTPAEAAHYIGGRMTETRIRRMAQDGRIGHRKDGRFLLFTTDDLDAYVASIAVPQRMATTRPKRR